MSLLVKECGRFPLKISHLEMQVADRVIMHRGDKYNRHSAVLRLRMSSVLDKAQQGSLPQRSIVVIISTGASSMSALGQGRYQ